MATKTPVQSVLSTSTTSLAGDQPLVAFDMVFTFGRGGVAGTVSVARHEKIRLAVTLISGEPRP